MPGPTISFKPLTAEPISSCIDIVVYSNNMSSSRLSKIFNILDIFQKKKTDIADETNSLAYCYANLMSELIWLQTFETVEMEQRHVGELVDGQFNSQLVPNKTRVEKVQMMKNRHYIELSEIKMRYRMEFVKLAKTDLLA
ncbi:uncharacterized protein LOC126840274 [Adelges cooleyi]|uniref:uncharacterized protein LOC126840274 n=1 Tax=Adelges cooleyi TaxID=133065 RepID=UPI0021805A6B|nr:uncharacterized protein LOC126840274 [Adelges cooleyi]